MKISIKELAKLIAPYLESGLYRLFLKCIGKRYYDISHICRIVNDKRYADGYAY